MPSVLRVITLLTDFGVQDSFVGVMKGVMLAHCPEARFVDLTHEIAPGDIRAGALALRWAATYFPPNTVHLAVVDPGVGGSRRPLVLRARCPRGEAFFVGPDNGLLGPAARDGDPEAWEIDLSRWDRPVSATFHGRDVFAPAAARLAAGVPPDAFCRPAGEIVQLDWPRPARYDGCIHGEVIYLDRFGNAITNLSPEDLGHPAAEERVFRVADRAISGPSPSYSAVPEGEPVVVLGSAGLYEVAIHRGSAAADLGLRIGTPVEAGSAVGTPPAPGSPPARG